MIRLSPEEFEEMVVQCYEGLPEGLLGYLENLDICGGGVAQRRGVVGY